MVADIMMGLYESEGVINVGNGGVVEDDGVVIVGEVAFAHLQLEGCKFNDIFIILTDLCKDIEKHRPYKNNQIHQ